MFTKSMTMKVKAGPEDGLPDGVFTAYASVFGNIDSVGDVVMPGAFANDLAAWEKSGLPIPLLFAHDMSDPFMNLGHVLHAEEDAAGLKVTCQLDLENPKALQSYKMLRGRRLNNMSFAYDEIDSGPAVHDGRDCWEIRACKIYEVSLCQVGANQETEILAVKSFTDKALWGAKVGRTLSAKNETELRDAHEAIGRVLAALDAPEKGKGFTPNDLRASLLDALEDVGMSASGDDPSRHAPSPEGDQVSREASQEPSVGASAVRNALLDIDLLEGAVA